MAYEFDYGGAAGPNGIFMNPAAVVGLPTAQGNKSITFWFQYAALPTREQAFVCIEHGARTTFIGWKTGTNIGVYRNDDTALVEIAWPTAAAWHFLAYTYDGTTHRLSLDGGTPATGTTATNTGTQDYTSSSERQTNVFDGLLEDVRVYDRQLEQAEVDNIYAARGRDGVVDGMIVRTALIGRSADSRAW